MLIDITLPLTKTMLHLEKENVNRALIGHTGTHFDVMDEEFPLEYTQRKGIVFNVSFVKNRDIDVCDVDIDRIEPNTFVAFYSGYIAEEPYGTKEYFANHPQLSNELLDLLINKGISIIGLDFAGARRGIEHIPADKRCANRGVFVVENLCNLDKLLPFYSDFDVFTYPINCVDVSGLPCRVIAKIKK